MVTKLVSPTSKHLDIKPVLELVANDMALVDAYIREQLRSDIALINQLGSYIIQAGGKRLRPVTLLLCAHACTSSDDVEESASVALAAIVEFIHTATLLHDDVVDESTQRRGKDTANEIWGNAASVLVGDFLYSRSFQMMVEVGSMRVMEILASTTNQIAEGEVMQLMNVGSPDTTEEQYFATIHNKTAILFASAAQLAAVVKKQSQKVENALWQYGMHLGTAFQLADDILDYTASAAQMGKNVGDDLAEGKPTLPLINALERASKAEQTVLRDAINQADRDKLDDVLAIIESTGSLAYTARQAQLQTELAVQSLQQLPQSEYRSALTQLAEFAVARTF